MILFAVLRERERERVMQKSTTFSSKRAKFLCVFLSFVLACSLIPSQALSQVAFANPLSFLENFSTVQSEDNTTSGFDVKAEWTNTGSTAKVTFSLSTDEVRVENNGYDILYLIDGGRTEWNLSWKSQIEQNINDIKEVSPNSRFALLEYSDGILPWDLAKDFTENPTIKNFTVGSESNWTSAFEESTEFVNKRKDKSRPVKVLMITGLGQTTKDSAGLKQAADGLKQVAEVNVLYANYGPVPKTLKQCASSDSQAYRADDRSVKYGSATNYSFTTQVTDALDQFKSDLNNKPVENLSMEIPVEDSWEIMSSNNIINKIEGNFGRNATSNNIVKVEADKVPSGQKIEWSFNLRFNGTKSFTLPATKESNSNFNYNGNPKNLNSNKTELALQGITVSYDLNGGTGDTISDEKSYLPGDMIYTKQGDLLTRGSDTFAGWVPISGDPIEIGESGTQYQAGSINIIFQAQYSTAYVHADAEPVTMPAYTLKNENGIILPNQVGKNKIKEVTFLNSIDNIPNDAITWVADEAGSGGVQGWAAKDSDADTYSVYYACDGLYPSFPNSCKSLFEGLVQCSEINNLNMIETSKVVNMSNMFDWCPSLVMFDISKFNTSNVEDMRGMFSGCMSLTSLDISNFDTSKVMDMSSMFNRCTRLISLVVANLNSSNVLDMSSMFQDCSKLTSLDVISFNTSGVTNMGSMFNGCSSLTSLDVKNFDTSKVMDMSSMFQDCSKLTSLDVISFKTSGVTNMGSMFYGCSSLTSLDVKNFDTSKVSDMSEMFSLCSALESLDLKNFNTSNVTDMGGMFYNCSSLESLNLVNFNTSNVKSMSEERYGEVFGMFSGCSSMKVLNLMGWDIRKVTKMYDFLHNTQLDSINVSDWKIANSSPNSMFQSSRIASWDLSTWDTSDCTSLRDMFNSCSDITHLNLSGWNTGNVTNMKGMFLNCSKITTLDVTNFNTSNVTDMGGMFSGCSSLTSLDVTNFNTSNVTDMGGMFSGCSSLTSLDVTNFNTSKVTSMCYFSGDKYYGMFSGCSNIKDLNLSGWDVRKVSDMSYFLSSTQLDTINVSNWRIANNSPKGMFFSSNITSWDLRTWDTSECISLANMFSNCSNITSLNLSGWDTRNVIDMSAMFSDCSELTSLDVTNFNTSNVTDMGSMFSGCSKLSSIDVTKFDTSKVINMSSMFSSCLKLTHLDAINFVTSNVKDMSCMFYHCSSIKSLILEGWDVRKVTSMSLFLKDTKLDSIDVSNWKIANNSPNGVFKSSNITSWDLSTWDTSECKSLYRMFYSCPNISELNLSGWDILNVVDTVSMFEDCSNLRSIKMLEVDTSRVTNISRMFYNCSKLTSLDLSELDFSNCTSFKDMFTGALVRDKSTVLKIKNMSDYKNFTQKGMLDFVDDITVEVVDTTPVEDDEPSVNNISEVEKAEVQVKTSYDAEQAITAVVSENNNNSLLDSLFNGFFDLLGLDKAYADTSVPDKYRSTVDGGQVVGGTTISYSLDAMNFGKMGKIPYIEVTGHIPEGLNFVEGSFNASLAAQKINSSDTINPTGKLVEKPTYDATSRTVKFKVQNLSAGAYWRVTFQCSLENTPDTYTQYFMNATYKTSTGVSATSNDVRHYAVKSADPEYNVTFKQDGDVPASAPSLPNARKYIEGEKVTLPDVPTALGYKASSWKVVDTNGQTVTVSDGSFNMPGGDVTITTTWTKEEVKKYKVTYKLNGQQDVDYPAEALSLLPSEESYISGSTLDVPDMSNVDIAGWQFIRWSSNDTTISDDGAFTVGEKNVEIVGTFQRKQFTVSFKNADTAPAQGVTLPVTQVYDWGDTVSMPADLAYQGDEEWTFTGWTNNSNIDVQAETFTMPKNNVEFVANWINIKMFKVTVNNGTTTQELFKAGDTVELTANSQIGKAFDNWTVDSGNTTLEDLNSSTTTFEMPEGDVEVTANLRSAKYTIKFDKNGASAGEDIQELQATYDESLNLPKNTYSRDGFTFAGWNTKADGTGDTYEAGSEVKNLTSTDGEIVTLYAIWNKNADPVSPEDPTNPDNPSNPGANTGGENGSGDSNNSNRQNNNGSNNAISASPLQLLATGDPASLIVIMLAILSALSAGIVLRRKKHDRINKH